MKKISFVAEENAAAPLYGLAEIMRDLGVVRNLEYHDFNEAELVLGECDTCGNKYESLFGDPDQCHGMSARVLRDGRIIGGYGSTEIDLEIWRFKSNLNGEDLYPAVKHGNICDTCIRHLKTVNVIECVTENYIG